MHGMSREVHPQPHFPETPLTACGELVLPSVISPHMEHVVTQLATAYGVDLAQQGAAFQVDIPEQVRRWLIGNLDGARIGITRCQLEQGELLLPDLDMVFAVTQSGWEPREIVNSERVWQTYVTAMQAIGQPVTNEQGDFNFAQFADFMAQELAPLVPKTPIPSDPYPTATIFSSQQTAEGGAR